MNPARSRAARAAFLLALAACAREAVADDAEAQRTRRLARQRAVIEAQIAAMERFGQEESFRAALRAVVDAAPPADDEAAAFRAVKEGLVPIGAFTSFVRWQSPRANRDRPVALDFDLQNHPYAAILDFDRQVRARGVDFLLVVLPSRLEIYPELVCDLAPGGVFAGMGIATQRFLLELNRAGVEGMSLTGAFADVRYAGGDPADQMFLRFDPHWTPHGAELAAKLVADQIVTRPWFERGPHVEGRDFRVEPREFGYQPNETLARRGAQLEPVVGNVLVAGDALFESIDPKSPIVVLGDSFVRVHSMTACDFCTQLLRFTGWRIDVIESRGGAAEQVRRTLARRTADQWTGKRLVVWLIPETLLVTSESWKPVKLEPPR